MTSDHKKRFREELDGSADSRLARAYAAMADVIIENPDSCSSVPSVAMPMHQALDAVCYTLPARGGQPATFAKVYRPEAIWPFTFDDVEVANLAAERAGKGPKVLLSCAQEQVIFFEHIAPEWRTATALDMRRRENREALIAAKKSWHRCPSLPTTYSPFHLARSLASQLEIDHKAAFGSDVVIGGGLPFAKVADWIDRMESVILAAGVDDVPIHGENVVSNVLINSAGHIRLVDFDRGTNGDPFYDLGAMCLDICRDDIDRMEVVEIYAGRVDEAALARLKLYGLLDDFIWGCWAMIADLDPRRAGPEWLKYARNRFIRLSYHFQTFDMHNLLGRV